MLNLETCFREPRKEKKKKSEYAVQMTRVHDNVLNDCELKSHVFTAYVAYTQSTAIAGRSGK